MIQKNKFNITDDLKLIELFREGKNDAFDKLVMKYNDLIFNTCFRIVNDYDEANDCAQETFIKAYKNIDKFRAESEFSTWLYRIAINTCKNRITSLYAKMKKKMKRIDRINLHDDQDCITDIPDCKLDPAEIYEKKETEKIIMTAIENLPLRFKTLIVLRDIDGKSYEQISEITGIKQGTVKSRLSKAREHLRDKLRGVI